MSKRKSDAIADTVVAESQQPETTSSIQQSGTSDSAATKSKKAKSTPTKKKVSNVIEVSRILNVPDAAGKMVLDIVKPRPLPSAGTVCKVISWNVAGLRAVMKKDPLVFENLIKTHDPDVICLQETKLQTSHVADFKDLLNQSRLCGHSYSSYWSCSTVKLGYSGTMVLVKKTGTAASKPAPKQATLAGLWGQTHVVPTSKADTASAVSSVSGSDALHTKLDVVSVTYDCELEEGSKLCPGEGRTITVEFPGFFVVNCYVPNAGQGLVRHDYRTKTWDPALQAYLNTLQQRKPVIFTGDLNCGHLDLDIYNCQAKHIVKQAGLTPEERTGFSTMLTSGTQPSPPAVSVLGANTGFVDALRYCYPYARGQFSYWSQISSARPVNKGLRLDYFVCSPSFVAPYAQAAAAAGVSVAELVQEQENMALQDITGVEPAEPRLVQSVIDQLLQRTNHTFSSLLANGDGNDNSSPLLLDSYTLPDDTVGLSDHGPVMLVLQL